MSCAESPIIATGPKTGGTVTNALVNATSSARKAHASTKIANVCRTARLTWMAAFQERNLTATVNASHAPQRHAKKIMSWTSKLASVCVSRNRVAQGRMFGTTTLAIVTLIPMQRATSMDARCVVIHLFVISQILMLLVIVKLVSHSPAIQALSGIANYANVWKIAP